MSVTSFHSFIFTDEQLAAFGGGSCVRTANLLTLRPAGVAGPANQANQGARNKTTGNNFGSSQRFALVLDAESCLDRLYGGYFIGESILKMESLLDPTISSPQTGLLEVNGARCWTFCRP